MQKPWSIKSTLIVVAGLLVTAAIPLAVLAAASPPATGFGVADQFLLILVFYPFALAFAIGGFTVVWILSEKGPVHSASCATVGLVLGMLASFTPITSGWRVFGFVVFSVTGAVCGLVFWLFWRKVEA